MTASPPPSTTPPGRFARWRQRLVALGPAGPLLVFSMVVPLLGASLVAATTATWRPWFEGEPWSAAWFVPLGAFLAAVILTGQLMANFLSNAGGAWDNAKKYIEDGHEGGKGSDSHKAAVIGDTVGDPFKDTAGPALNPLIKVMNLVSLVVLPAIISTSDNDAARYAIAGVSLVVLAGAIVFTTRQKSTLG